MPKENHSEQEVREIKTTKIPDIWYGEYTFDNGNYEQSFTKYTIVISKEKCFLYIGNLPACQIICYPEILNNKLFLYYNNIKTDKSKYDYSIVENSKDGDTLVKLFKVNNKYFVNSKLINYWNDDKREFEENLNIEVIKI